MALVSRQLVLDRLAATFPDPNDAERALAALDGYKGDGAETVHMAIIKLSEGRFWRLRELVQVARRDFRDVLFPAQAPEQYRQAAQKQRPGPGWCWGTLPPKPPSPKKAAALAKRNDAMRERDQKQWLDWLSVGP